MISLIAGTAIMRDERQKHGSQTDSDTDKLSSVMNREPPQINVCLCQQRWEGIRKGNSLSQGKC